MKLTDKELLEELKERFQTKDKALNDYQRLIEELGSLNQKLKESEMLKSQFLSNIRNEINNPFASILGLSRQLVQVKETSDLDRIRTAASLIYAEAFDLNFQLKNIFAAAESEAGEVGVNCSKICLHDFLQDLVNEFMPMADHYQVSIELKHDAGENEKQFFCTDPEKLQLIVANLISNAIKFSNADPVHKTDKRLEVTYTLYEEMLSVSVRDEGVGIAAEDQERIFDRFIQLDHGMTKVHKGHGLGLSVVKAALDLLEGVIQLESNTSKGSAFIIQIPERSSFDSFSSAGNEFLFEDGELF